MLGVHQFRISGIDPEKLVIKLVGILDNAPGGYIVCRSLDTFGYTWIQFFGAEGGNGLPFVDQVVPKGIDITRAREPAGHTDHGDGPGRSRGSIIRERVPVSLVVVFQRFIEEGNNLSDFRVLIDPGYGKCLSKDGFNLD